MYLGSWKIDDVLTFPVNTHDPADGAASDADSVATYRVYEDETATPILTGDTALLDSGNTVGLYSEQITLSAANGFEKGKTYTIYITATVNSVVGTMSHTFQMEAEVSVNFIATSFDTYQGHTEMMDDEGSTDDHYGHWWALNGQPVTAGITSPTIQIINAVTDVDLVGVTAMTEVGSRGMYYYIEPTNRIVNGVLYLCLCTATIGGASRTWPTWIYRDSSA